MSQVEPLRRPTGSQYRWSALIASLFVHVALFGVLIVFALDASLLSPIDIGDVETEVASQPKNELQPEQEPTSSRIDTDAANVSDEAIRRRLDRFMREHDRLSDEQKLNELATAGRQLERLTTPESIDRIADRLQSVLGTADAAEPPAELPPDGEFDPFTAVFRDVKLVESEDGESTYFAILFDGAGRKSEVPMDAADGKLVYDTLQLIRDNPLLESVYQKIALPLIDKMLAEMKVPASDDVNPAPEGQVPSDDAA